MVWEAGSYDRRYLPMEKIGLGYGYGSRGSTSKAQGPKEYTMDSWPVRVPKHDSV